MVFPETYTTECMREYVIYTPHYLLELTLCKHLFLGRQRFSTSACAAEEPRHIFVTSFLKLRKLSSVSLSEKIPLGGPKHTWKCIIKIVLNKELKSVKRIHLDLNADQWQGHVTR